MSVQQLISEHLDLWTAAHKTRSSAGRGSSNKLDLVGIKKLRELILELAVRGKLVPQDPNDEPASELLRKIALEKQRLIKAGKIKKEQTGIEVSSVDGYYEIPEGWDWVRLGNVINFINGYAFKSSDFSSIGVGIVKIGDIQNGVLTPETMSRVDPTVVESLDKSLRVEKGDMLIAMSGATTGKLGFNTTDECFYLNQRVGKICPYLISSNYLYFPLTTKIAENLEKSLGSAIPNLSTAQINDIIFALPPLAEQHRIVAKVDELMTFCDQLEQSQTDNIAAHEQLVEALLTTLTNSQNSEDLQANWQRLAAHFDTLFTTEHSIDQLKQAVLQLAVMGKLVPQNPNDEPASELLKKIAKEKELLIKEGKIKKQKSLPEIADVEKPFKLPDGWEFVRLQNIINISSGDGLTASSMNSEGGIPVFGGNGINGYHDQYNLCKPTIVIGRVGYYCGSIHITPEKAWVTDNAFETKFSEKNISILFLYWLLRGTNLKENENATAQPVISGAKVYPIVVGLPPLAEQHRIVAKVDELMTLCDTLKTNLQNAQVAQLALADALVEQAVN